jgi:RimJ/RimL family protein N-acetyltransferase
MQSYPTLKTSIPYLQLQPLAAKHVPFLVDLLSDEEIQRSLYRIPTVVTAEKEMKSLANMYSDEKPKEITYVLTIKKLFTEKHIGFVKIKLIDWSVKSCYLSVAILPNPEYRGKGYAKVAYDSFFQFLFELGFMKIYGRTYETNTSTIQLNKATGFTFVGRQRDFVLYPNDTSLDALLFERVNPLLSEKYQKLYSTQMRAIAKILQPIASARYEGTVTEKLLTETLTTLRNAQYSQLPSPLRRFISGTISELENENGAESNRTNSKGELLINEVIRNLQARNAIVAGLDILAYPITISQYEYFSQIAEATVALLSSETFTGWSEIDFELCYKYGAYTKENWHYLETTFLGLPMHHAPTAILASIKSKMTKV